MLILGDIFFKVELPFKLLREHLQQGKTTIMPPLPQEQQPFYGPLSGTNRVNQYQKKNIHPPIILIIK